MNENDAGVVDVVFALAGTSLPAEHTYDLWRAVVRWLPWFDSEPQAGIHPLRVAPGIGNSVLLARRAKLVLRVPQRRLAETLTLSGRSLAVGEGVEVGAAVERPLRPWATLHAQRVALGVADEIAFVGEIGRRLAAQGVSCEYMTGRARRQRVGERDIEGYSVVLHGVHPGDSLRIQCEGIGADRALGWGIFIPHKSIAAVA
ncbi:MAG: type I-MYXAN CRISPR-associated protein Cas6/Cmx6 [Candidatus Levyibacteriota bacterium]